MAMQNKILIKSGLSLLCTYSDLSKVNLFGQFTTTEDLFIEAKNLCSGQNLTKMKSS